MVNALPIPPKLSTDANNVLATETPSPAPITPTPATVAAPKPDSVPIPVAPTKPLKTAEKNAPPPPRHPQPVKVDPTKVQTGEAPGLNVAMSSIQTRVGTSSINVTDSAFGTRFAFYIQQINQKLAAQWLTPMLDPNAKGHRVYIVFQVGRDGTPSNVRIQTPSGDKTLDQTALHALQRIDTFGPLPDGYTGNYINAVYQFDPPDQP